MHWCPGNVHTKRRPASAGTLGERGYGGPSTQVLTLQKTEAIKLPPNQKRERTTGKKRLKGHGPGHTQSGLQARSKDQEILEEGGGAGPSLLPRRDHE